MVSRDAPARPPREEVPRMPDAVRADSPATGRMLPGLRAGARSPQPGESREARRNDRTTEDAGRARGAEAESQVAGRVPGNRKPICQGE